MTDRDYEVAKRLKSKYCAIMPIIEMRVFGSRAREDNATDSDPAIFVEVERLDRSIRRLLQGCCLGTEPRL